MKGNLASTFTGTGEEKSRGGRRQSRFHFLRNDMCGFTGWFQARGQIDTDRRRQLTAALDLITHRGPDDGVEVSGDAWWMGFRRLSILDLSTAARQPMAFG